MAGKLSQVAPIHSNECLVPRPTETFVASKKHNPGYSIQASTFCKAGDGFTQGKCQSIAIAFLFQFSQWITSKSACQAWDVLKYFPNSPNVL